ncbi:radical SAM protein [Desulfovibrio sp. JC022]|uniref:B12-binding domain-containing radical SAM protein n=1 Tax=Desulfovibrio sp. JC022 TaxID=2593642 RepID=UPI0013D5978E|nr:radical SAM protein [Desulfovibrio sp. JC022]NDV24744.1 B12-binding domain-containing radical SAM protein [Desulfovibrio sp. JC022]
MRFEGKVYRPWIEWDSLLIQTTLGCTHNKCTFCNMFRDKRFSIRSLEDIFQDIEESRRFYRNVRSVFLVDGNVLALKTELLLKIINTVKDTFPECEKISLYAGLNDFRRKSVEELKELRVAGLTKAYTGLESGDPVILEGVKKGLTPEQAIEGMAKAKEAGIEVLASFIFGMGGKDRSQEHIEKTVELLNILKPEEIAPMALTVQPGTELEEEIRSGQFIQATPLQMLEEEKYLLENMNFETFYWGDHGNNIVSCKGMFPGIKENSLRKVESAMVANPVAKMDILHNYAW